MHKCRHPSIMEATNTLSLPLIWSLFSCSLDIERVYGNNFFFPSSFASSRDGYNHKLWSNKYISEQPTAAVSNNAKINKMHPHRQNGAKLMRNWIFKDLYPMGSAYWAHNWTLTIKERWYHNRRFYLCIRLLCSAQCAHFRWNFTIARKVRKRRIQKDAEHPN